MANLLVSVATLSLMTQQDSTAIPVDDEWANFVLAQASEVVCDEARHPEWTELTAPVKARQICLAVARRTYENPSEETRTGVGPISSSVRDEAALGLELSEQERADLQALRGVDGAGNPAGLYVMTMAGGLPTLETAYVPDSSGSDWWIPLADLNETDAMVNPDDVFQP